MSTALSKYYIVALVLGYSVFSFSQECSSPELVNNHKYLKKLIKTYKPLSALIYADSILRPIPEKEFAACEMVNWIRYEQGEAFELNGMFEQALALYENIIKHGEIRKWWTLVVNCHLSMARCYESIDRPTECLRHLNHGRSLINELKIDSSLARLSTRYSSYHRIFANKDSARLYAEKSIAYGHQYHIERSVVDGHLILGILIQNLDSSIYHLNKAVQIFNNMEDYHGVASQLMNITSKLMTAGKYDSAANYLEKAQQAIMKQEDSSKAYYRAISRYCSFKKTLFEKNGTTDSAYFYSKKELEYYLKAEWYINHERITINAIESALEKEKIKQAELQKSSKIMRWGIIVLSLVILVISLLLFLNYKKKIAITKQNNIIQLQNAKLEETLHKQTLLLSEVHHRIKNNLQMIISFLNLHRPESGNPDIKNMIDDISAKVDGIALIHEQLYRTGDFTHIDLYLYLDNLLIQYQEFYNAGHQFNYEINSNTILLNIETAMPVGVICCELIANSIKHAQKADKNLKINLDISQIENKYIFKYRDNGPGYSDVEKLNEKSGMGLILIKNMVRQIQAACQFDNDQGAHFSMVFVEKKTSGI